MVDSFNFLSNRNQLAKFKARPNMGRFVQMNKCKTHFLKLPVTLESKNMKKILLLISLICTLSAFNAQVIIPKGSLWKYLNIDSAPPITWNQGNFDDVGWPSGAGELGYGETDETTVLIKKEPSLTYYFRKKVIFSTDPFGETFNLYLKHDDGAIVYINGVEIIRTAMMPIGAVTHTTGTTGTIPSSEENNYHSYTISGSNFQIGENTIAIEVHNQNTNSSDVSFDAELTISRSVFPKHSSWKYLNIGTAPPGNWNTEAFDDTAWMSGVGELGFGDGDEVTQLIKKSPSLTYYFRKKIDLTYNPKNILFKLNIKHDDGVVIYINGVEAKRSALIPVGPITHTTGTTGAIPDENIYHTYILAGTRFHQGKNTIAIELHNQNVHSSDISFDAELIIDDTTIIEDDGPYVLNRNGHKIVHQITNGQLLTHTLPSTGLQKITCPVGDGTGFQVNIREHYPSEKSTYPLPQKMLVFSDIEGNMPALVSLLKKAGVINNSLEWTYGKGHVVYAGDMFDRGSQVIECLWLIYKLEAEATAAGGKIHFILGNHDIMNLINDLRYVNNKYFISSEIMQEPISTIHDATSELGKWLRSKNAIEKIGPYIFLHGGISPTIANLNLSYTQMNDLVRQKITNGTCTGNCATINSSSNGLYWYRGISKNTVTQNQMNTILLNLDGFKIFMGHTIVADAITTLYNNKAYMVDIHHDSTYRTDGTVIALLYENCRFYQLKTGNSSNILTPIEDVSNNITLPQENVTLSSDLQSIGTYSLGTCYNTVGEITTKGHISDITGAVYVKEWIDQTQHPAFVKRHLEINKQNGIANNAMGILTIYFSQEDFDSFNMVNSIKLPVSPNDAQGIANLRIAKILGSSQDGSGVPQSYSGQESIIDPIDSDIKWDPIMQVWSVKFPVIGWGAFFIKTNTQTLASEENTLKSKTTVYPTLLDKNDSLIIDFPGVKGTLNVLNIEFRPVKKAALTRGINTIPLNFITSGYYLYHIIDEKENVTSGKLIVK